MSRWNFAAEEQAFDRVYRIGQKRKVFVHRLVIKDSVGTMRPVI